MAGRKKRPKITEAQRRKLSKAMKGNKNGVGANSGRPTDYNDKIKKRVYRLHLMMVPVEKICEIVGISKDTYYTWKKNIPEFADAIERGIYGFDEEVIVTLKKKATGYTRPVVKVMKIKNKLGEDEIVNHIHNEYFPPDQRAIETVLRNRGMTKQNWSNIPDPDAPPPPPDIQINNIDISQLDDETLNKLLKALNPGPDKS